MERTTLIQEYYLLAVDEKGNIPPLRRNESNGGLIAAGLMDLLLGDVIALDKKKISVTKELPQELGLLEPLYTYLQEKPRTTDRLMSDYLLSTGARLRELTDRIGEALTEKGMASEEKGGLFGKKTIYLPDKSYKEQLISAVKEAAGQAEEMSAHDGALIFLLQETKNLYQYFSKYESEGVKSKLKQMKKEIQKDPQNKQLAAMINYVNDISAVAMACMVTASN
ncbi:MAG TPA: GPP34 family phosphoprotein [Candidatus Dorea gallistercoris]|uniref:GPP34 family phosphoprotein n=1 Tax=Candidatus Dorea gallistercoris TaxID=2838542 RepID=A0A9D1UDY3_9FIRM|nr:GPP34 family phosphoprotein [Candidatus Dorea gallistercoris]